MMPRRDRDVGVTLSRRDRDVKKRLETETFETETTAVTGGAHYAHPSNS